MSGNLSSVSSRERRPTFCISCSFTKNVRSTRPRAAARTDSDHVERLARALGWASVGLGLPQLLRPGAVTRAVGVGDGAKQQAVTAAVGARELVHAAGLLTPRIGARWV